MSGVYKEQLANGKSMRIDLEHMPLPNCVNMNSTLEGTLVFMIQWCTP